MLTIIFVTITIGAYIIRRIADKHTNWFSYAEAASITFIISCIFTFIVGMVHIVMYTETLGDIQTFQAVKQTIEDARKNTIQTPERVMFTTKVATWNGWLARTKYWNTSFLVGWFYPDSIEDLTPIQ